MRSMHYHYKLLATSALLQPKVDLGISHLSSRPPIRPYSLTHRNSATRQVPQCPPHRKTTARARKGTRDEMGPMEGPSGERAWYVQYCYLSSL